MDQQTLLYVMTAFVVIAGISMLLQLVMILGIYKTAKATQQKVDELAPKVHTLIETSQKAIEQSRVQMLDITTKTNEILDTTRKQLGKVDDVLNDATGRLKAQMQHAEMVLDDTMSRAHETVALVHSGIMKPLREIQGISAGVRAAIAYFARGARPMHSQATQDEEMFIG